MSKQYNLTLSIDVLRSILSAMGIELPRTKYTAIGLASTPDAATLEAFVTTTPLGAPFRADWVSLWKRTTGDPLDRSGGEEVSVARPGQYL